MSLLDIKDLKLSFQDYQGISDVLHGIDLHINAGERVALVGESGSGKSVTARIVLGLLQEVRNARITGNVVFNANNIRKMDKIQRAALRGTDISMIFQDPTSSLNPTFTIENQFTEVLRRRTPDLTNEDARTRIIELIEEVSISDPERILSSYSFQLSGGMNQRIMIAMALANRPKLLLADEPGTALDVTVQSQTLRLMRSMVSDHGTAVLFISHNLGVVREFADRLYIIYRGRIVETGTTTNIFANPGHAYTRALLSAVPRITGVSLPELPESSDAFMAPMVIHGDAA